MEFGRFRRACSAMVLAVAVSATMVACGAEETRPADGPVATPPPGDDRGVIVENASFAYKSEELTDAGASMRRITYRSTSGVDGSPTTVSGVVAVPPGDAPTGGWPIVVYGHGSTGVLDKCGPSLDPGLMGSAPALAALIQLRYVAVMPDYQGLGTGGGRHPYLEPRTIAFNMIDAARAARYSVPNTSTKWAAFGSSQGGQGAWAANELNAEYGQGLDLVGSVSLSPPTDMTPLIDDAEQGRLTEVQKQIMPLLAYGVEQVNPMLTSSELLPGVSDAIEPLLLECIGSNPSATAAVVSEVPLLGFTPENPDTTRAFRDVVAGFALPRTRATQQMMVIYGGKDDLVLPEWTKNAVRRACADGDSIVAVIQPGNGHAVDPSPAVSFLADRFAGVSATDTC